MKKALFIMSLFISIILFGCNRNSWQDKWFFYDNTLTVEWVFEDMENYVMSDKWILVLNWYFEDHADHIYFPQWMREEYFESENDYLPWNTIKFMWNIEQFDAWAWNHYYKAISVYKMKTKWYPDKDEIKNLIDSYNYCETVSDCVDFDPGCDFECSMSVNRSFENIASKIVSNYNTLNKQFCKRDCASTIQMACENSKCIALTERPMIDCTDEEKIEKECSNKFEPVCWNDNVWYNNSCFACQSKSVTSYFKWWCDLISYFIEGTPRNLDYVLWFLNNWSVSCNMSYTFEWKDLWWKIIADKDRFFAIRDIYYNWKLYHNYWVLSVWWERYEWLEELPTINRAFDFSYQVKNEIEWVLVAAEVFEDFSIECHNWIDDEDVFIVPNYPEFELED